MFSGAVQLLKSWFAVVFVVVVFFVCFDYNADQQIGLCSPFKQLSLTLSNPSSHRHTPLWQIECGSREQSEEEEQTEPSPVIDYFSI